MNNFSWVSPKNISEAAAGMKSGGAAIAGGMDLLCLLKDDLIAPNKVVNLKSLPGLRELTAKSIGALVRVDDVANSDEMKKRFTAIAEAAQSVGSPQIRNVGTVGGNLCQRPRCWYFRDPEVHCLKKGGDKCYAVIGNNEYHAVLAGGPCYIVHPSDLAPAFMAFDATITTNERKIPIENFFVLPSVDVHVENVLKAGEIVTGVQLANADWQSSYYKMRERESFDWSLASCAVALKMSGGKCIDARIALGGVAPVPLRAKEAEAALKGQTISAQIAERAGKAAFANADPMDQNAYKIPLGINVVKISVMRAAGLKPE